MIRTVFEYIAMLQKCGPQAWFYSELRDIENIKFRFREEVGFVGVLLESHCLEVFSNCCNV